MVLTFNIVLKVKLDNFSKLRNVIKKTSFQLQFWEWRKIARGQIRWILWMIEHVDLISSQKLTNNESGVTRCIIVQQRSGLWIMIFESNTKNSGHQALPYFEIICASNFLVSSNESPVNNSFAVQSFQVSELKLAFFHDYHLLTSLCLPKNVYAIEKHLLYLNNHRRTLAASTKMFLIHFYQVFREI